MQKVDLFEMAKEYGCQDSRQGCGRACDISEALSSLIRDEIQREKKEYIIDKNIWQTYGFQYTDCPNVFALEMIFEIYTKIRLREGKKEKAKQFLQQYSAPDPATYTSPPLVQNLTF